MEKRKTTLDEPSARAEWLENLRTHLRGADAIMRDLLRPARERELGHRNHEDLYDEARAGIEEAMASAGFPLDEDPVAALAREVGSLRAALREMRAERDDLREQLAAPRQVSVRESQLRAAVTIQDSDPTDPGDPPGGTA